MNSPAYSLFVLAMLVAAAPFGFSTVARADQPAASCVISGETIDAELRLSRAGDGIISGVVGEVAFECRVILAEYKDCRRCASIVDHILTFDRGTCETDPVNASVIQFSERIPMHIFSSHAELGLFAGTPRVGCQSYSFDEDSAFFAGS